MIALIKELKIKHPTIFEMIRFGIVGFLATVFEYFIAGCVLYSFDPSLYPHFYNVLINAPTPSPTASMVSTGLGYTLSTVLNYILSIIFVFNNKGRSKTVLGFTAFVLLSIGGLGLNVLGMFIFKEQFGINYWISKLFISSFVLIYNYLSKKFLIFRKGEKKNEEIVEKSEETVNE